MILGSLTLHNVGTFAGKHTIDFTPEEPGKPIVLIGGLNGAGKTTVLEAIHLALYGSLAPVSGRRAGSYENYLRGLVHRGVPLSDGAAIELTFHAHQQGQERTYWIRRSWKSAGKSVREIFIVRVDGKYDNALAETWNDFVETFLPRGIAGLFFFDGEQIEALADMEKSREVLASALASLLGLDLVDRLGTDLAVLKRRHRSKHVPDALRVAVDEQRERLTALRQIEDELVQQVAALRIEQERARHQAKLLSERYRAAGGELLDQRETAEARAKLLTEQLGGYEDDLRGVMAEASPLLLVRDMLSRVGEQAEREASAARGRIVSEALATRDEALLTVLGDRHLSASALAAVNAFLAEDRGQRHDEQQVEVITGLTDAVVVQHLAKSVLPTAEARMRELLGRRESVHEQLEQAERVVVAIPDAESIEPLLQERDEAHEFALRAAARLAQAEEQLETQRAERRRREANYESALTKAAEAGLNADDDRRVIEHVDRVAATLERLREAAVARHLAGISQLVFEALGRLQRKSDLITGVTIDPKTHTVSLEGADGGALQASMLSAGERQLLAVALLWGLARASGQPLPVIVDTPLGRLDSGHRRHLLDRYFPYASHQVVLLSTDTEIDAEAYELLKPHIGRSYRLHFDTTKNATSVTPGYFWEPTA